MAEEQVNLPAAPAVTFALVPADLPGIYNYQTRQGLAAFQANSKSLYNSGDDLFDVEAPGLQTFLGLVGLRAITASWDMRVPTDIARPLENLRNLLQHHGEVTLEDTQRFATSYVNSESRAAQENMQQVQAILASLTLPGYRKVQAWRTQWHAGDTPMSMPLIKVIIREAYIDTQATSRILREKLSSLPGKLSDLQGDVSALNAYVMVTLDQLAARGEYTQDLIANLFKGYLSSEDRVFVNYIEKKQEDYDEGEKFSTTDLMALASNKYKTLVENGRWMAPSKEEKKILALETKLMSYEAAAKSSTKAGESQAATAAKKAKKKSKDGPFIPEWSKKHPGDDFIAAGKSKKVDGKEYFWCEKHARFVRHKTSECNLDTTPDGGSAASSPSPGLRVTAALLMEE